MPIDAKRRKKLRAKQEIWLNSNVSAEKPRRLNASAKRLKNNFEPKKLSVDAGKRKRPHTDRGKQRKQKDRSENKRRRSAFAESLRSSSESKERQKKQNASKQ